MQNTISQLKPKLSIVGAGPGDPELITLKAINALKSADVVLFDALANEELLEYCHENCEKIYVGKRGHESGINQDQINTLIVEKALEKGHVVRLKGGDPFVFGRGMEEIYAAAENNIEYAYIPGISSVLGGGTHMIPLTDRRFSDGYWVITGHKADGSLSKDLELAAKTNTTIVLLMAMSKLAEISGIFAKENKGHLPAAIIHKTSTDQEKIITGPVNQLAEMAHLNFMKNPAIIIIGEVVNNPSVLADIALKNKEIYA